MVLGKLCAYGKRENYRARVDRVFRVQPLGFCEGDSARCRSADQLRANPGSNPVTLC